MKRRHAIIIGIAAAILHLFLGSVRLTSQGLFYDEVHQAPAAFAYVGKKPEFTTFLSFGRFPLLNMTYSGAIKSTVYGLYMRLFGSGFSITSWRLLGLLFVCCGIFAFVTLSRRGWTFSGILVFTLLLISDASILLMTRHDWGPVALALLLRLLLLGIWLRGENTPRISPRNSFLLGALTGFSLFEKVSNIGLLPLLFVLMVFSEQRRTRSHLLACLSGLCVGALPLIIINLMTFAKHHFFISLAGASEQSLVLTATSSDYSHYPGLLQYIGEYLSLGSGALPKRFILGSETSTIFLWGEGLLLSMLLLLTGFLAWQYGKQEKTFRLAGQMLLCYVLAAVVLRLLPRPAQAHHWIIGTPFQILSLALAFMGVSQAKVLKGHSVKKFRFLFFTLLTSLFVVRIGILTSLETALLCGESSVCWDPSHTLVSEFAARHQNEALFVAGDWGIAHQIYSLSNGEPNLVKEVFWDYKSSQNIDDAFAASGKKTLYIIVEDPPSGVMAKSTEHLLQDISDGLSGFQEQPLENELTALRGVRLWKFSVPIDAAKE